MNVSLVTESVSILAFGFGGPMEIMIIGGIALLMFGKRLPGAAKSLGMSFSSFKKGLREGENDLEESPPRSIEKPSPPEKDESES